MTDTFRFEIGSIVRSGGELCGTLGFAVVDPASRKLTHLEVIAPHGRPSRLVPIDIAVPRGGEIELSCTPAEFDALEPAETAHNVGLHADDARQVYGGPFFGLGPGGARAVAPEPPMVGWISIEDHLPAGEVRIRRGERVHAADGHIGRVRALEVDAADDHLTQVLVEEGHLRGRKRVAVPISAVTGIGADSVSVGMTKDELRHLPAIGGVGPDLRE